MDQVDKTSSQVIVDEKVNYYTPGSTEPSTPLGHPADPFTTPMGDRMPENEENKGNKEEGLAMKNALVA